MVEFSKSFSIKFKVRLGHLKQTLTQNLNIHRLMRSVVVLVPGSARVRSLVRGSLDILNGDDSIVDTLSHVGWQPDVLLFPDNALDGIAGHWTLDGQRFARNGRNGRHLANVGHACELHEYIIIIQTIKAAHHFAKPIAHRLLTVNVESGRMDDGPGFGSGRALVLATVLGFHCRYIHMTDYIAKYGDVLTNQQSITLYVNNSRLHYLV